MRLTHCYVTSVEMDKDGVFLTTAVLPLAIKYTVVVKWRSPADGVVGLGGLTVQALCLSGYSHYPPPQSPAQLSLHQGGILWLENEILSCKSAMEK